MALRQQRAWHVLLYALLCILWGSTWLAIKVGYGELGPFTVAAIRFVVAAVVLIPIVPIMGARWPKGRVEWGVVTFVGLVLFGVDYGLIYWGEQFLDSGLTAVLFATLPLVTVLFAHAYLPGDRITPRKLAGTLLAFLGVVALFADHLRIDVSTAGPMLAILASTVCAAAAAVVSKRHGGGLHAAALNAPAMLVGAGVLLAAAFVAEERVALPADRDTWSAILYLAVAGSVVTFLIYFSLLKTWSVTSLSFISVFTPVVAMLLGFVFLDERPTVWTGLGAGLILTGVVLALTKGSAPWIQGANGRAVGGGPRS